MHRPVILSMIVSVFYGMQCNCFPQSTDNLSNCTNLYLDEGLKDLCLGNPACTSEVIQVTNLCFNQSLKFVPETHRNFQCCQWLYYNNCILLGLKHSSDIIFKRTEDSDLLDTKYLRDECSVKVYLPLSSPVWLISLLILLACLLTFSSLLVIFSCYYHGRVR